MFEQDYFLKKYNISLDQSKSLKEQLRQMAVGFELQDIETGDRPYIFISYAHKDAAVVFPAIKALQDKGYPVWFDEGIRPGEEWSNDIADHVRKAALVIAFMSKNAIESRYCRGEIQYAYNNGRPVLTVKLDQSNLPSGLDMQMSPQQMLSAYLYDGDSYIAKLMVTGFIDDTAGVALNAYYEQQKKKAAEEAERRHFRREEAERKRREAESEIKRLDVEETELRKQSKEKKQEHGLDELWSRLVKMEAERETHEGLLGIPLEEEKGKKLLAEMFKYVQENLLVDRSDGYELAMLYVQSRMKTLVKFNPSLQADMEHYEESIHGMVYQEARILEKTEKYRDALERYDALGDDYLDSRQRCDTMLVKQEQRYKIWLTLIALAYCVNHCIRLSHFDGCSFSFMVYTLPMMAACFAVMFGIIFYFGSLERVSERTRSTIIATIVVVEVITIIMDLCAFSGMLVWQRILRSLWYNVLGAIIGLIIGVLLIIWFIIVYSEAT